MNDAYKHWDEIERKSGNHLFTYAMAMFSVTCVCMVLCVMFINSKTGVLVFGEKGLKGGTESVINALSENSIPHDVLSGAEVNARYSDQLKVPDRYVCTFEHSGGILRANKAVATLQVCALLLYKTSTCNAAGVIILVSSSSSFSSSSSSS